MMTRYIHILIQKYFIDPRGKFNLNGAAYYCKKCSSVDATICMITPFVFYELFQFQNGHHS